MREFQHAIVIGASSGIGAELVKQLAAEGTKVAAVARRGDRLLQMASDLGSNVVPVEHDVTHYDEVPQLFQRITQELGGLDLVIYVAGVMPAVGPHEYDFAKDKLTMDVNVLGAIAWLNQAAIRFENTRHGSVVAVGSVAGDRGRSGQPVYNASKAALTTYMEALRNRLAKLGVAVVTIKPGPTATEMTSHLHMNMMPAAKVAEFILKNADKTGEHYVKLTHRVAFAVIRSIPSAIFRRLKI
jgi:NAD(P)-dependent dehydrogenase (short-subunit alcohol dehydrogenase family)